MGGSIRSYQNYQAFLADHVSSMKVKSQGWSLNVWKRHLGIASAASLSMILNGQRHPGKNLILALAKYFQFNPEEARYFEKLVSLQKKSKSTKMSLFLNQVLSNEDKRLELKVIDEDKLQDLQELLMNPLTHILREMTTLKNFRENVSWISQALKSKYSYEEITELLERAIDVGLIKKIEGEGLKISTLAVRVPKPNERSLELFHQKVLGETVSGINSVPQADRAYHVSYLNIRKENLELAKKMLREFQSEFNQFLTEEQGDEVYQLSMQFIPITSAAPKAH